MTGRQSNCASSTKHCRHASTRLKQSIRGLVVNVSIVLFDAMSLEMCVMICNLKCAFDAFA